MTKFLLWHKCDYCGRWVLFKINWIDKNGLEYCSGICADRKTNVTNIDIIRGGLH